jgi:hypothetical protein
MMWRQHPIEKLGGSFNSVMEAFGELVDSHAAPAREGGELSEAYGLNLW